MCVSVARVFFFGATCLPTCTNKVHVSIQNAMNPKATHETSKNLPKRSQRGPQKKRRRRRAPRTFGPPKNKTTTTDLAQTRWTPLWSGKDDFPTLPPAPGDPSKPKTSQNKPKEAQIRGESNSSYQRHFWPLFLRALRAESMAPAHVIGSDRTDNMVHHRGGPAPPQVKIIIRRPQPSALRNPPTPTIGVSEQN